MKAEIVIPRPMTDSESYHRVMQHGKNGDAVWTDFSAEKIEKALFLDIDGVIQPFTDYRFNYVNKSDHMEQLYKRLEDQFNVNYREFHKFDVTAVVYDWDKDAVAEIKRVLDVTGAKIVVSSDWRSGNMIDNLPFLLRIHDLEKYLYGYTPIFYGKMPESPEYEKLRHNRSIEILEYLRTHPHIRAWVAVDDKDMSSDLPLNFVKTDPKITTADADKCIEILNRRD